MPLEKMGLGPALEEPNQTRDERGIGDLLASSWARVEIWLEMSDDSVLHQTKALRAVMRGNLADSTI